MTTIDLDTLNEWLDDFFVFRFQRIKEQAAADFQVWNDMHSGSFEDRLDASYAFAQTSGRLLEVQAEHTNIKNFLRKMIREQQTGTVNQ